MDINDIIDIALGEGFADAAIIDTGDIVFDASFRPYCEENLCGWYGANYSCPPSTEQAPHLHVTNMCLLLDSITSPHNLH